MANVRGMGVAVITSTVGWLLVFCPQFGPLRNTKTVLFVNDGEAEIVELHGILNDSMGANQNVYAAVGQTFQHALAAFSLYNTREKLRYGGSFPLKNRR